MESDSMFIRISNTKSVNVNHIICASTVQYNINNLCIIIDLVDNKSLVIEPEYITNTIKEALNLHF